MKEAKKSIVLRVYLVYLGILLFGFAIIFRVIMIQSLERAELTEQAIKQELTWVDVEAIRGNICADDGTLLATTVPIFDIRMDLMTDSLTERVFRQEVDSLAWCLSHLFGDRSPAQYSNDLWSARNSKDRFYLIKRKVTYPEVRALRTFPIFRKGRYQGGLIIIPHYQRELPYKSLAKRTIGYESESNNSKVFVGLEGYFSDYLQGVTGKRLMRKVGNGSWVPVDLENQLEPQNGDDIITTIDINIQDLTERALRKELKADSAEHGCAIVMEVETGHVKAIANLTRIAPGVYEERYNYAVGESTEPGSTFKLASFIVALEDNKIQPHTLIPTGNGQIQYHGRNMKDSHRGGYGTITAQQVFENSSNVGTSMIITEAYQDHPEAFIEGLYKLGIQNKLGIQIHGEGRPNIKDTKNRFWSKLSLPWMSIGYEVAMTPLQVLTLYNAVANNGVMVKPLFVDRIQRNGEVVKQYETTVLNPQICSATTLSKLKKMLKGVVDSGTATNIRNPVYNIAGKTGTAQIAKNNRGYGQKSNQVEYKASFVGFFPVEDPKYSIMVVINNPMRSKYYGATVAGPVFKEVADQLYAQHPGIQYFAEKDRDAPILPESKEGQALDIQAIYDTLGIDTRVTGFPAAWSKVACVGNQIILTPDSATLYVRDDSINTSLMPDVKGMGMRDALFRLEALQLKVETQGKGIVVNQSPPPGAPCFPGDPVRIELHHSTTNNSKKSTTT